MFLLVNGGRTRVTMTGLRGHGHGRPHIAPRAVDRSSGTAARKGHRASDDVSFTKLKLGICQGRTWSLIWTVMWWGLSSIYAPLEGLLDLIRASSGLSRALAPKHGCLSIC